MGLGGGHVYPSPQGTRPFPKQGKKKKKKAQFENLLLKEGYTCGRGSGDFGARLWGRGLAGTDWEDLAPVLSSPRGLPGSVGGRKLERTALCEIFRVKESINRTWILEGKK